MEIRTYGEVVLCRNIKFEDNVCDMEVGHPGVILLPTSEKDDYIYCLYMTSDEKRAIKEKEKYVKNNAKSLHPSYINIQQIIKRINNKDTQLGELQVTDFENLLEDFYNYQVNLEPQKEEFLEIKDKVKVLIELLHMNKEFDINKQINSIQLNEFSSIKDEKKVRTIYKSLLLMNYHDDKKLVQKMFIGPKDRLYAEKLIEVYNKFKNINFDKLDLTNPNNNIREIYLDFKSKNYLINTDYLFLDASSLLNILEYNDSKKELINNFLKLEKLRNETKRKNKTDKKKRKDEQNRITRLINKSNKLNRGNKRLEEKYGKFDVERF